MASGTTQILAHHEQKTPIVRRAQPCARSIVLQDVISQGIVNDISDGSSGPGVRNFFRERRFEYHILNAPVLKCAELFLDLIARFPARLKILIPRWTKSWCQMEMEWTVRETTKGSIAPR